MTSRPADTTARAVWSPPDSCPVGPATAGWRVRGGTTWSSGVFGGSDLQVSGPTGAMVVVLLPVVAHFGAGAVHPG